jgi:hypothetical protein
VPSEAFVWGSRNPYSGKLLPDLMLPSVSAEGRWRPALP